MAVTKPSHKFKSLSRKSQCFHLAKNVFVMIDQLPKEEIVLLERTYATAFALCRMIQVGYASARPAAFNRIEDFFYAVARECERRGLRTVKFD